MNVMNVGKERHPRPLSLSLSLSLIDAPEKRGMQRDPSFAAADSVAFTSQWKNKIVSF